MTKREEREYIYNMYDGRCAYCGEAMTIKQMQVDHVVPIWRNVPRSSLDGIEVGEDVLENKTPACRVCNNYKNTMSLETFREELGKQLDRAWKKSSNYRLALRYKQVSETPQPIVFYFEKVATRVGKNLNLEY